MHRVGGPLEWQPGVAGTDALLGQGEELASLAAERGVDVLHTCSHAHAGRLARGGEAAAGVAVVHTAHSDVLTWWRAVHGCRPDARYDAYGRGLRAALERADAVVVPSRSYGRALAAAAGDARPLRVIHNGIDPGPPPPAARRGEAFAFAAARFGDPLKNLGVLGEAARRLGRRLRVAGTGGDALGDAATLGHLGRAGMDRELSAAAVFAGPARFEPFGLGVLEAAAAGCALVLADQPTHRELWEGAAVLVPADDPDAWADALEAALSNSEAGGAAARERSLRYGIDATASAYASLYREAAARCEASRAEAVAS